ncbi:MAG: aminopeptidase [Clostridia bacterium]|jgi:aspartyl aminopeptidase|nr:aminopeptidase [Clostridia bacterium]CDC06632.1 m18 family aminopeptidase [Clostridium sp. CAG:343]HCF33850.1 aminopeptidase [Clostridiales bacterium]
MEEELKEKLFNKKDNGWETLGSNQKEEVFDLSKKYMDFLNVAKTEREFIKHARKLANENGYKDIMEFDTLKPGDKIYFVNREKSMYLAIIGEKSIEEGLHIIGSHVDSPRLDLKPNPLYEDTGLAYFKTHYYGGIKKYQWTTIPLSIHGVIVKANGEKIEVNIGEDEEDPIFTITDLLPHLAQEQMEKKLKNGVDGEDLNLLIGSIPYSSSKISEKVKLNILNILNQKYGITEADLTSSEIELVPAFKARSLGFDGSMVAAYGQDDKVCAYTSLHAMMELENVKNTAVCILSDKEEIGSMGNTGMESHMFDFFISEILNKLGVNRPNLLDKVFCFSKMLSSDVDAGFDPIYASVSDKHNAGFLGKGISLNKYTGARGKSGASDANAEYVAWVRNILERNDIKYQIAELGKVDIGGGGTIAYIIANKGADVIDCGVPVLSMHAPYEVTSKYDIYSAYKTYKAFWEE